MVLGFGLWTSSSSVDPWYHEARGRPGKPRLHHFINHRQTQSLAWNDWYKVSSWWFWQRVYHIRVELVPTSSVEHFHEFSPCSTAVGTGRPRHTAAPFLGEALARQHIQQQELKSLKLYTPQGGTLCYRTEIRRRNPVLQDWEGPRSKVKHLQTSALWRHWEQK